MLFAVQPRADVSREFPAPYEPSWVDLLDPQDGERVQLVGVNETDAAQAREFGALVDLAAPAELDLIALSGQRIDAHVLRGFSSSLAPGGRLALVVDNALSPLRVRDAARSRRGGTCPVRSLRRVRTT